MRFPKFRYALASPAVLALLVITLAPVVPYHLKVDNPGFPYSLQGYQACVNQFAKDNVINADNPDFQRCIAQTLIPPIDVTGYGSVSFSLLGVGVQPFPDIMSVGESDFYALLHISGTRIVAAEQVSQQNVIYNPSGITISNSSLTQGFLGNGNATITVTNTTGQTLVNPLILVSVPGSSGNSTDKNGVTWIFRYGYGSLAFASCMQNGKPQNLGSGASCTATFSTLTTAQFGSPFRYSVEVQGHLGSQLFITERTFTYSISSQAANRLWTDSYVKLVNEARNGSALIESSYLDAFAKLRFSTAVAQPDISDYGFYTDESSFFATNSTKPSLVEVLLYPNIPTEDPYSYAEVIQHSAPGHWSALTDRNYTRFGYFIGTGPYEIVQQPCPIFEIPGAGVNITQYFEKAGCSVTMQQSTWLVIILSN